VSSSELAPTMAGRHLGVEERFGAFVTRRGRDQRIVGVPRSTHQVCVLAPVPMKLFMSKPSLPVGVPGTLWTLKAWPPNATALARCLSARARLLAEHSGNRLFDQACSQPWTMQRRWPMWKCWKTDERRGGVLTAHAGDVIAIIGSSGSGKSTFLRCIDLLERPHAGRILFSGEELTLKPGKDGALQAAGARQLQRLRARLAMLSQHFNLWAQMTALENVIEAPMRVPGVPKDEAVARAEALMQGVGVAHRKGLYPSQLSGGEQQRVAIARAPDGTRGDAVRRTRSTASSPAATRTTPTRAGARSLPA
jgi:ABC transporter